MRVPIINVLLAACFPIPREVQHPHAQENPTLAHKVEVLRVPTNLALTEWMCSYYRGITSWCFRDKLPSSNFCHKHYHWQLDRWRKHQATLCSMGGERDGI